VLGCYGGQLLGFHLTSFLVNDSILLDAGSPTEGLDLEDQHKVRHIFLSHTHLDHIKDIAFLADNRSLKRLAGSNENRQIVIHSLKENLEVLHRHFLNDKIWPDFTKIPTKKDPILALHEILPGQTVEAEVGDVMLAAGMLAARRLDAQARHLRILADIDHQRLQGLGQPARGCDAQAAGLRAGAGDDIGYGARIFCADAGIIQPRQHIVHLVRRHAGNDHCPDGNRPAGQGINNCFSHHQNQYKQRHRPHTGKKVGNGMQQAPEVIPQPPVSRLCINPGQAPDDQTRK